MEKIVLGVIANILRTYAIYRFIHLLYFPKVENKVLKNGVYILFVVLTSGGYYIQCVKAKGIIGLAGGPF